MHEPRPQLAYPDATQSIEIWAPNTQSCVVLPLQVAVSPQSGPNPHECPSRP